MCVIYMDLHCFYFNTGYRLKSILKIKKLTIITLHFCRQMIQKQLHHPIKCQGITYNFTIETYIAETNV